MKKYFYTVILLSVLLCALTLPGCPTGKTEDPDVWSEVSSWNMLNGTWKTTVNETFYYDDFISGDIFEEIMSGMEEFGDTGLEDFPIEEYLSDLVVIISSPMTVKIDAAAMTLQAEGTVTLTFSSKSNPKLPIVGMMLAGLLPEISESFRPGKTENSVITDFDRIKPIEETDLSMIQINQTGKKAQIPKEYFGGYVKNSLIFTKS